MVFEELVKQFGEVRPEYNDIISGYWINPSIDNKDHTDKNKIYWTIVPDTAENRHYFVNFRHTIVTVGPRIF